MRTVRQFYLVTHFITNLPGGSTSTGLKVGKDMTVLHKHQVIQLCCVCCLSCALMEMDSGSDQKDESNGQESGERVEAHITCTTVHWLCHNMFELYMQT